ncbi:MAG: helix-turn-helix transcriptional regulator [Clostridia bacterium]|nr:helix-turn-helix transcriptional regulator [Clostridia bacterium]
MGKSFRDTLDELIKDPEFKAEYDALEPEFQVIRAMLSGRESANITQKELAEKTGIAQADISRIENGNGNPSIRTLQRLANGMGMALKIEFVPLSTNHS